MGVTFKENCPDVRNTRVVDVMRELEMYGAQVDVFDPWADPDVVREEYNIELKTERPDDGIYDGIVLAVAHDEFATMGPDQIRALGRPGHVLYDIKHVLDADMVDGRL